MAKETNANDFELDLGAYEFAKSECGCCHPGGGSMEYDRQGNRYDEYLAAGNTPAYLSGDYYHYDETLGAVTQSPWSSSGVLEIDCFMCHLEGYSSSARATEILAGNFKIAPFAGAGLGTVIDNNTVMYDPGLAASEIALNTHAHDHNCAQCHAMDEVSYVTNPGNARSDLKKRGFVWGPVANTPVDYERDVHDAAGLSCTDCHTASIDHQIAKGNEKVGTVRNDLDFTVQSCGECHTDTTDDDDHVGIDPAAAHASAGFTGVYAGHFDVLDCTVCHIPFKDTPALRTIEAAAGAVAACKYGIWRGGSPGAPAAWTGFEPTYNWWPVEDGTYKLFPMNIMTVILWGEPEAGTGDLDYSHFARNVIAAASNAEINNDDPSDSKAEVNTADEILSMRAALAAQEASEGDPNRTDPYLFVLPHLFSLSHNIRPSQDALGANGCADCHDEGTWIFDGDFRLWHYAIEDSPYVVGKLHIVTDDGSHDEVEIDFSDAQNNFLENWKIMGYSQARRDELVEER